MDTNDIVLKQLVESYQPTKYKQVRRGDESYKSTLDLTERELARLVSLYSHQQTLQEQRLIRDAIDHWLRRYHGYAIEGSIGSHYIEQGVDVQSCIFEHVIPASKVRDMLLQGILTINQAMNTPTCLISSDNDKLLRKHGHVSSSPDYWNFFNRYAVLDSIFVTHDGKEINSDWNLQKHYKYFGIV
jgi:hypothetical protein